LVAGSWQSIKILERASAEDNKGIVTGGVKQNLGQPVLYEDVGLDETGQDQDGATKEKDKSQHIGLHDPTWVSDWPAS